MERKLVRDISKLSQIILHRIGTQGCRPRKTSLVQKTQLQTRQKCYAVGMLQWVWGLGIWWRWKEAWRKKNMWRFWKKILSSKRGTDSTRPKWMLLAGLHKALTWMPVDICGGKWRPRTETQEDGLVLLRRCVRLVENYNKQLKAVIPQKGYTVNY